MFFKLSPLLDLEENGHFSNRTTRELDEKLTRVSNERDQLKSDYQMMLDKMREMKTVVGARLQEEIVRCRLSHVA